MSPPCSREVGCRITEFRYRGYSAVTLENDNIKITLLPGKGSDVIQFLYKPSNIDFMWASEPGLPSAASSKRKPSLDGGFLENYPGGWQEILPNFGDACDYRGVSLSLHAEVSLLEWSYRVLKNDPQCISVELEVQCKLTPFRLRKTLTLRSGTTLEINEQLQNDSAQPVDCMWGHHPVVGPPVLGKDCRLFIPRCRVKTQEEYVSPNSRLEKAQDCEWPVVHGRSRELINLSRIPPKTAHSHDMAYLYGMEAGWYLLFNEALNVGFAMRWDHKVFKYLWLWQVYGGWEGHPWYCKSYNLGLEPCTSYPQSLAAAVDAGTQLKFAPRETKTTYLEAAVVTKSNEFLAVVDGWSWL